METQTIQIILSLSILILGFIYFIFPFINNIFFKRPYLVIEFEPNKGITKQMEMIGHAPNTDFSKPVNLPNNENDYNLNWKFNLIIRNNSEYTAYNVVMYRNAIKNGNLDFISQINRNKPLPAHQELVIPFTFSEIKRVKNKDIRNIDTKEPDIFSKLELLINYTNYKQRRFNTLYKFKNDELSYKKITTKKIKSKWEK